MKKRALDLALAVPAFVVALPVMGVIGLGVAVNIGRPVIFTQVRRGKDDKPFIICKLRTMKDATDEAGNLLPDPQRHTPFGLFLRRSGLDELPQLWNIIKGDMSIVGPRPRNISPLVRDSIPEGKESILSVRPGLTSPAQLVMARRGEQLPLREKLKLDFDYALRPPSLRYDLGIIFETAKAVLFKGTGSDNGRNETIAPQNPQP